MFQKATKPTNIFQQILVVTGCPSSHNHGSVENGVHLGDKPHIFQDPIFHETMIMGGRVREGA